MTTKTSLHKKIGLWAAYAETFKQNRSILIFGFVLMLAAPLYPVFSTASDTSLKPLSLLSDLNGMLYLLSVSVPVVMSAILPFLVFGYLHNRRAVDLYHSLPIKRFHLFTGKFLSGLTVVILPCAIGYGLGALVAGILEQGEDLVHVMGQVMLFSITFYVFVVFVLICCGTVWEAILYSTGLSIALLGICYSVPEFASSLYGYAGGTDLEKWLFSFTPFYYIINILMGENTWSYLAIVPVLMSGVLFMISVFLYQSRKSENTGSAFSFRFLFHIVSIFITIAVISTLYSITNELISALLIGFLAYFIMSVLANRGFKKLLFVTIRGGVVLAATCMFVLSFQSTGGYGYELRVPELDKIESVTINMVEVGDGNTYHRTYMPVSTGTFYPTGGNRTVVYRQQENIRLLRELHEELINEKSTEYNPNTVSVRLELQYQLRNGQTLSRKYYQTQKTNFQRIVQLNKSEEFLMAKYPFLKEGFSYGLKAKTAVMDPYLSYESTITYENLGIPADEVAEALKKDILARPRGFETAPSSDFVGRIAILNPSQKNKKAGSFDYIKLTPNLGHKWNQVQSVLVYECDTNILTLLEKRGKLERFQSSVTNLAADYQIQVTKPLLGSGKSCIWVSNNGEFMGGKTFTVTNEADRAFLLKHLQPVYYSETPCYQVTLGGSYYYLISPNYNQEIEKLIARAEETNYAEGVLTEKY